MKIIDPHVHMTSRTTDDYERMAAAGVVALVEPAFWLGQPRTTVGSFVDYFNSLLGWERFRASQFGIRHFCTIGLNPKEANNPKLADPVLELLPRYLVKDGVVAVGEVGYDDQTDAEETVFARQVELAREHNLPVLVHTPHRDKKRGTIRSLQLIKSLGFPEERVLIDHNNEETLPLVLETGCWAGHSIYPNTKMDEGRMAGLVQRYGTSRIIVNSAADWGISDPLKVPKTVAAMREAGIEEDAIRTIVWENPLAFFSQSGRFDLGDVSTPAAIDRTQLYESNSVLRGERATTTSGR
jgi:predicted metal-dependent TIM-barrel fold hydrolase